jgi:hypothetical protein
MGIEVYYFIGSKNRQACSCKRTGSVQRGSSAGMRLRGKRRAGRCHQDFKGGTRPIRISLCRYFAYCLGWRAKNPPKRLRRLPPERHSNPFLQGISIYTTFRYNELQIGLASSPAGQIRWERIWSHGARPQGSGQDSPKTLGGERRINSMT